MREQAPDLLVVSNIECNYGPVRALRGVSLSVESGTIATVLGSNGAGKSTILKTISGVLTPVRGSIWFKGENIAGQDPAKIVKKRISHVPEGREVFPMLSVHDNLLMGAYTRPKAGSVAADMERVFAYFPILKERLKQSAGLLSGGQQQMLAISRALMAEPELMILDEPSLGLSPRLTEEIFEIIVRINREQGVSILLVEQNANLALKISDWGFVIENGRLVMEGPCSALAKRPEIAQAYLGGAQAGSGSQRRARPRTFL